MAGYDEFVEMLKKKGFPAQRPGAVNFNKKATKDIFNDIFREDFSKDGRKDGK